MLHRQVSVDGQEQGSNADDDFLVYPAQILLEPGGRQTVRVTWLGDPAPGQELPYRLLAEQLPIEQIWPDAGLRPTVAVGKLVILYRYKGSAYIRPRGVKPDVVLEEAVLG